MYLILNTVAAAVDAANAEILAAQSKHKATKQILIRG